MPDTAILPYRPPWTPTRRRIEAGGNCPAHNCGAHWLWLGGSTYGLDHTPDCAHLTDPLWEE